MWWNKITWKRILPIVALLILTVACFLGDGGTTPDAASHSLQDTPIASIEMLEGAESNSDTTAEAGKDTAGTDNSSVQAGNPNQVKENTLKAPTVSVSKPSAEAAKDQYKTEAQPAGKPAPVEPQSVATGTKEYTCTIWISCATLLNNMDRLSKDKKELVPADGWILKEKQVTFYEGESVFNILQRVCKQEKIHMEYENTPIYNSAYLEGIGNLYEFDAGDLSGWMYQVNDWFPNYGCSRYQPKDGDVIKWVYTCNLGDDVGGGQALAEQKS